MTDGIVTQTATRIFADLADPQTVNKARDDAWQGPLWQALSDAGLTLAWVPEDLGGAGAGAAEGFEIARIAGRYAAAVPIAETLLAGWLLAQARIPSPAGAMTVLPARPRDTLAVGANGLLSGTARRVPFARAAGHFAVVATGPKGAVVALVDPARCQISDARSLEGIAVCDVLLSDVRPLTMAPAPAGFTAKALMQMGATVRAVATAGALETVLAMATQYAQDRVAFGKPIAKFQAIQHALARLAGEASAAMIAAGSAADAIAAIDADSTRFDDGIFLEAASARIRSAEAATEGSAIAHQVFGAIGFTKEHVLHRFTLRLLAWRDDFGNDSEWAVELGTLIAAKGADGLWPFMAQR